MEEEGVRVLSIEYLRLWQVSSISDCGQLTLSMGQSLLKWQPSSHARIVSSGPRPQIWPKGQLESDRQPGRHTLSCEKNIKS